MKRTFISLLISCGAALAAPVTWQYTLEQPAGEWTAAEFVAEGWDSGEAGFGSTGDNAAVGSAVNTEWTTNQIFLRRTFQLDELPEKPALLIYYDEDPVVYLNGRKVLERKDWNTSYELIPLEGEDAAAIQKGENVFAVGARQDHGAQYIDVHLIDTAHPPDMAKLVGTDGSVDSKLITEWGAKVTPENAWREYPRPQMVRENWSCLNGNWNYAITGLEQPMPEKWDGDILVPFPIESKLSGVKRMLQPYETLWYQREIEGSAKSGERTLLHFGAVDYESTVWVNGTEVGSHRGGNLPFSFDITDALVDGKNTLAVKVLDATGGAQLRGKQTLAPGGIFYTRNSGIWQTVWTEQVPASHIESLTITHDLQAGGITITPEISGDQTFQVKATVRDGGSKVAEGSGEGSVALTIPNVKLWSPANPALYQLRVQIIDAEGKAVDSVDSYTAMREVGTMTDAGGHRRLTLNGQPIFHWGPLDQGWWPDGLLTPPSDDAMVFEIKWLKEAGFNMIRKHIKVEPARYYYHCDQIGMLVWQDHVSGGESPPWTRMAPDPTDAVWPETDHKQWMHELDQMITGLDHFQSIVMWVPFNEAWGQHRTMEVGNWVDKRDETRLVNIASGGNFWPVGDIADEHRYPDPGFPLDDKRFDDFVKVVGEFGGHGWAVDDHLWIPSKENWGYGGLPKSLEEYRERYKTSMEILSELKDQGIAAGVYTQTTDVEGEVNGLMTYDRKVQKISAEDLREIARKVTEEK